MNHWRDLLSKRNREKERDSSNVQHHELTIDNERKDRIIPQSDYSRLIGGNNRCI